MNRIPSLVRTVATLLAALVGVAGAAGAAPSVAGQTFDTCGTWAVKLRDFGKFKIRRYNDFIPASHQLTAPTDDTPRVRVEFGDGSGTGVDGICSATTSCFRMQFYFTNGIGSVSVTEEVFGLYRQKGRKLKLKLDPGIGDEGLRRMLSDTGELALLGARNLVSVIGGPLVVDSSGKTPCTGAGGFCTEVPSLDKVRLAGRVSNSLELKLKLKSSLTYDIDSDVSDVRGATGSLRFKGKGRKCPLPPPP